MAEKWRGAKEPLDKGGRGEWKKTGLKLNIQKKKKIMASGSITLWQIHGETMETVTDLIFLISKITAEVTAAMKLKQACSVEEKLGPT